MGFGPSKPIPKGPRLIMEEGGRESAWAWASQWSIGGELVGLGPSKPIPKGPRLIMEEGGGNQPGLGPHSGLFSSQSSVLFLVILVGQNCEAGGPKMVGVFKETPKRAVIFPI